jgi:hypothetical protein
MYKAKITFSVGSVSYPKGFEVPAEVAVKYPRLVIKAEKDEIVQKAEKVQIGESLKVTEKVKKGK